MYIKNKHTPETIEKMRKIKLGKKQSKETIEKRINKVKGDNHWRWICDRSKLKKSPNKMNDTKYKYWVKEVRTRDYNVCKLSSCDCKGRLESHHIFNWRDYPELRYVVNNGITLCQFHHPRKWEEEKRMIPIFQELLSVSKE